MSNILSAEFDERIKLKVGLKKSNGVAVRCSFYPKLKIKQMLQANARRCPPLILMPYNNLYATHCTIKSMKVSRQTPSRGCGTRKKDLRGLKIRPRKKGSNENMQPPENQTLSIFRQLFNRVFHPHGVRLVPDANLECGHFVASVRKMVIKNNTLRY